MKSFLEMYPDASDYFHANGKDSRTWDAVTHDERVTWTQRWMEARELNEPKAAPDMVNHPPHYTSHPSGVECIQVTEHMSFCIGNAVKYLWRADEKGSALEDLKKARWYIEREIARREVQS